MSEFVLAGGQTLALPEPAVSIEPQVSGGELEHGLYYAGKLGATVAIARWHARKRRFVFVEYALGSQQVRAVAYTADGANGEGFTPLARIEPRAASRVSDYAFETAR
jgi:hypothetical protein